MDDDGLNMRNWGYYEPSLKEPLGFQFFGDNRDTKPVMIPNGGGAVSGYHHHHHHQPAVPMPYMKDSWIQRERLLHMLPGNASFPIVNDPPGSSSMHIMQSVDLQKDIEVNVDDNEGDGEGGSNPPKKRSASKTSKGNKPKKVKENGNVTGQRSKVMKRNIDMVINGIDMDISGIPIPVCSCTGNPQQCYRWGSGGWQSACCTTTISMYPLPMSTKRRGARIAGRKMSQGAFKKVLEKLASEGYDFGNAIDLRLHWAKHGTNKFVTIR